MTAVIAAEPRMVRVAAIQAEPAWNDLEAGVNKSIALIEQAAAGGANVLGFPEVFIPGYPWYAGKDMICSMILTYVCEGVSGRIQWAIVLLLW